MVSCRALCCGLLTVGPALLLALLLGEPPAPGPRQVEAVPLKPGGKLAVLNLTAGTSSPRTGRLIYLRRWASEGIPTEDIFGMVVYPLQRLKQDHVVVRTKYVSIDPGPLRGQLGHSGSELPDLDPRDPALFRQLVPRIIAAETVGIVEESNAKDLPVGTAVRGHNGITDSPQVHFSQVQKLSEYHEPLSAALGVLGVTGRTAYHGVMRVLRPKPGETLLVTGAAGATGLVAGQLGKIAGCRVIGSAGTAAKVKYLVEELGFDAAFNYREEDPDEALDRLAPAGIDLFFENTGGPVSEAAFGKLREGGRVAVSGLINWYHTQRHGLRSLRHLFPSSVGAALAAFTSREGASTAARARLLSLRMGSWHSLIGHCDPNLVRHSASVGKAQFTVEHFLVTCFDSEDNWNGQRRAEEAMAGYIREGKLKGAETVLRGSLEDCPRAAINVWAGGNTGKQLIELI